MDRISVVKPPAFTAVVTCIWDGPVAVPARPAKFEVEVSAYSPEEYDKTLRAVRENMPGWLVLAPSWPDYEQ